jgi:hypothetical protein
VPHAHDRLDDLDAGVQVLQALASWVAPQMLASVE